MAKEATRDGRRDGEDGAAEIGRQDEGLNGSEGENRPILEHRRFLS